MNYVYRVQIMSGNPWQLSAPNIQSAMRQVENIVPNITGFEHCNGDEILATVERADGRSAPYVRLAGIGWQRVRE